MRKQYKAYLLRLRRDENQRFWRASLEDAHTGELIRFANQNELLRYLLQDLTSAPSSSVQSTQDKNLRE